MSARQMTLVAFLQAQNCSNYAASWRHPATMGDFMTPAYYQRIARTLEAGRFHLAFFDDRLAIPDMYGGDHAETVRHGIRAVKLDLVPLLTAMGLATTHLGLGATYSTTYYEPFHVARVFATLDLMTAGRIAWNVVTSLNDSEAANFGAESHLAHYLRYDRADEFLEVVLGHWDTWQDGAIIQDRAGDLFADPAKVKRLDHAGQYFRSRGPFTVPRSAQGHPVLMQAGQSGRGRAFAARWAELIFAVYHSIETGARSYADLKAAIAEAGRDPDAVNICPACYVVVAPTAAQAKDQLALVDGLARREDELVLMSEGLNFDFSRHGLDDPLDDDALASMTGLQAFRDRVVKASGKRNPTTRDFMAFGRRGTVHEHPIFCGSPKDIADEMEAWFTAPACDGFVIAATHMPGNYEEVCRLLVPELQRRGLFQTEYRGTTLRENLGLARPAAGDWHRG